MSPSESSASFSALPIDRPSLALLGSEPWRAALEFFSHKVFRPTITADGDGHTVIVFPGLATDGRAVAPLREHCSALGYRTHDWGRGFNAGPDGELHEWLAALAEDIRGLLPQEPKATTLIGWSLGGLYARELGKLLAPSVRQVITIATPFNAEADHTNVGWLFRLLSGTPTKIDAALSRRLRIPPPVPTTSIYSRTDGVVAWQTCRHDQTGPRVEDIEIEGSHIGMAWNPAVLKIVADRLAQRPGKWLPFSRPS